MDEVILQLQIGKGDFEQDLMNQAVGFFNGGSRCIAPVKLTPTIDNSPMAPAIVCFAFAAELFLKLVHHIAIGSPAKTHGLNELWNTLPQDLQDKLREKYAAQGGVIEPDLVAVNKAFVDWRYLHEQGSIAIDPRILTRICKAAYILALELRPTLQVFGENQTIRGKPCS